VKKAAYNNSLLRHYKQCLITKLAIKHVYIRDIANVLCYKAMLIMKQ